MRLLAVRTVHPRGQGLLESLLAIAVLGVGLGASLQLLLSTSKANDDSQDRAIAYNLVREGIEIAHSLRDSNWLNNRPFDSGLQADADYDGTFVWDAANNGWGMSFTASMAGGEFPAPMPIDRTLYYVALNGLWQQNTVPIPNSSDTGFHRIFYARAICDNTTTPAIEHVIDNTNALCTAANTVKIGVDVTVKVEWRKHNHDQVVQAEEYLYDWRL